MAGDVPSPPAAVPAARTGSHTKEKGKSRLGTIAEEPQNLEAAPVNWLHAAGLAACVVPRRVAGGHRHGLSMILPASPAAVGVFEGATVVCPCSRR